MTTFGLDPAVASEVPAVASEVPAVARAAAARHTIKGVTIWSQDNLFKIWLPPFLHTPPLHTAAVTTVAVATVSPYASRLR